METRNTLTQGGTYRYETGNHQIVHIHESPLALSDWAKSFPDIKGGHAEFGIAHRSSWLGRKIQDFQDADQKSRERWEPGEKSLRELREKIPPASLPPPVSVRRRREWSENSGDDICLDRLRSGTPYWASTRRQACQGSPVVTLVFPNTTSGSTDPWVIDRRGAVGVILADLLESAGYRVELYGYCNVLNTWEFATGWATCDFLRMKGADDPVDIASLAVATSSWYYRTIHFEGWERDPVARENRYKIPLSYGVCGPALTAEQAREYLLLPESSHVIATNLVTEETEAIEEITRVINLLNEKVTA